MKHLLIVMFCIGSACSNADEKSPYVSEQQREIKALSSEQVSGYLSGKGMGLARAAELNGYPGPKHVLDLSEELQLSDEQKSQTHSLFAAMSAQSQPLGARLVDLERQLDQLFASKMATETKLHSIMIELGAVYAQVREVHLKTHIKQKELLTPAQVVRYNEARGYSREHVEGNKQDHHHDHSR
ncbi:hypothetical protein NBRC116494_05940 [Aurantivibrio plasticivorans]